MLVSVGMKFDQCENNDANIGTNGNIGNQINFGLLLLKK